MGRWKTWEIRKSKSWKEPLHRFPEVEPCSALPKIRLFSFLTNGDFPSILSHACFTHLNPHQNEPLLATAPPPLITISHSFVGPSKCILIPHNKFWKDSNNNIVTGVFLWIPTLGFYLFVPWSIWVGIDLVILVFSFCICYISHLHSDNQWKIWLEVI